MQIICFLYFSMQPSSTLELHSVLLLLFCNLEVFQFVVVCFFSCVRDDCWKLLVLRLISKVVGIYKFRSKCLQP